MSRVYELTDEEIACIETGLNYLSMYDKEFAFIDCVSELINKLHNSKLYIGGVI